jgi:hypothetical protein
MIENKIILYLALCVAIVIDATHGFYFVGIALFFCLISLYLFLEDRKSFIKFVLLWLSAFNLFKELFLDPLHFNIYEFIILITPIFARLLYKNKTY